MDVAARLQTQRQLVHQWRLNQAALVVAFFVPRVRKEDVHAVQTGRRQHVLQYFDGIVRTDANVAQLLLANALEQRPHAGIVHFAAQKVEVRQQRGDVRRGLAHAKANFEHQGRGAAKGLLHIQRGLRKRQQIALAPCGIGSGLPAGDAARTAHKAAHCARMRHIGRGNGYGRLLLWHGSFALHARYSFIR